MDINNIIWGLRRIGKRGVIRRQNAFILGRRTNKDITNNNKKDILKEYMETPLCIVKTNRDLS